MKRRALLLSLAGGVSWLALPVRSQERVARIGFLSPAAGQVPGLVEAFAEGLREAGYIEGRNLLVERRFPKDSGELAASASELAGLNLGVIVATGGPAIRALQQVTSTTPLVMTFSGDPVGTGLVASLARPGGNLTGLSFMSPELSAKRVEMLVAGFPGARCLAALWNPTDPVYALELERTERAASSFGLTLLPIAVRSHADFEAAFVEIGRKQADALIVFAHTLTILHRHRLIELANRHRLPTMYGLAEYGSDGGLISYGPRLADSFRRSAYYVDRILKGASPADLPIEQPTKLQLVINLKTAATLGLNIPPSLLAQADEVIE